MLIHLPSEQTASILRPLNLTAQSLSELDLKKLRGQAVKLSSLLGDAPPLRQLLGQLDQLPPRPALGLLALPPFGAGVIGNGLQGSSNDTAVWSATHQQWMIYSYAPNTRAEETLPDQLIAFYQPDLLDRLPESLNQTTASRTTGVNLSRMVLAATLLVWGATFGEAVPQAAVTAGVRAIGVILAAREAQRRSGKVNVALPLHHSAAQGLCLNLGRTQGLSSAEAQWRWAQISGALYTLATDLSCDEAPWITLASQASQEAADAGEWSMKPVHLNTLQSPVSSDPHACQVAFRDVEAAFTQVLRGDTGNNLIKTLSTNGTMTHLLDLLWTRHDDLALHHPSVWRQLQSNVSADILREECAFLTPPPQTWNNLATQLRERGAAKNQQTFAAQLMITPQLNLTWQAEVTAAWANAETGLSVAAQAQAGRVSVKDLKKGTR